MLSPSGIKLGYIISTTVAAIDPPSVQHPKEPATVSRDIIKMCTRYTQFPVFLESMALVSLQILHVNELLDQG